MRVRMGWILVFMVAALPPGPCLAYALVVYLVVWGSLQPLQILHENCSSRISQCFWYWRKAGRSIPCWPCFDDYSSSAFSQNVALIRINLNIHQPSLLFTTHCITKFHCFCKKKKKLAKKNLGRKDLFPLQFKWIPSVLFRQAWLPRSMALQLGSRESWMAMLSLFHPHLGAS